jgi:hypothetical protein
VSAHALCLRSSGACASHTSREVADALIEAVLCMACNTFERPLASTRGPARLEMAQAGKKGCARERGMRLAIMTASPLAQPAWPIGGGRPRPLLALAKAPPKR